jgi:riboflavin biosynthesis pyrimidine reductase
MSGQPDAFAEFHELYPGRGTADLAALYEPIVDPDTDRHVRVNMVASVDGGTTVGGTSASLGGAADHETFMTIRSSADVIVVGAATMRDEHYGPARLDERRRRARLARGQTPVPPIAVITRSAGLDWHAPFFTEAEVPPLIVTVGTAPHPPAGVADLVIAETDGQVDFGVALDQLVKRGYRNVLVEGGPTINGEFAATGAVDELCLTISPRVVVGSSRRVFAGADLAAALRLTLASVVMAESFLLVRYVRAGLAGPS